MATQQAYIGYNNIAAIDNITVDSEQAGYPVEMLFTPATNLRWRSASTSTQYIELAMPYLSEIDYVGIAGHNFGSDSIQLQLQGLYSSVGDWVDIGDAWTPETDAPIMHKFDGGDEVLIIEDDGLMSAPITETIDYGFITGEVTSIDDCGDIWINLYRFRIALTPTSVEPEIAVLSVGKLMQLQRGIFVGHTPITYGRDIAAVNGLSESGQFLGRICRATNYESEIRIANMSSAWYRSTFEPFVEWTKRYPFFFAWRADEYPDEVGYCWASKGIPVPQNTGPRDYMSVSFRISGMA